MKKIISLILLCVSIALLPSCSPKVGSEKWCRQMEEKPKGEWTANEASDYAKHCLLK